MKKTVLGIFGSAAMAVLCACSASVTTPGGGDQPPIPVPQPQKTSTKAFTGLWAGKGKSTAGGGNSDCDVSVRFDQAQDSLQLREFSAVCADGQKMRINRPLTLTLQQNPDPSIQAKDLMMGGSKVGWLNNDNTSAWIDLQVAPVGLTLSVKNIPEGLDMDVMYTLSRVLQIDIKAARLTAN